MKMIKLRLEAKEEDIVNCIEQLKISNCFEVMSVSKMYSNTTGLSIYKRCYVEVDLMNCQENDHE